MLVINGYEILPLSRDFVLRNLENPQKRVFVNFDPKNLITEKIDPAYLVQNFAKISIMLSIFAQNGFFVEL